MGGRTGDHLLVCKTAGQRPPCPVGAGDTFLLPQTAASAKSWKQVGVAHAHEPPGTGGSAAGAVRGQGSDAHLKGRGAERTLPRVRASTCESNYVSGQRGASQGHGRGGISGRWQLRPSCLLAEERITVWLQVTSRKATEWGEGQLRQDLQRCPGRDVQTLPCEYPIINIHVLAGDCLLGLKQTNKKQKNSTSYLLCS